jgi:hypothetical protein
MGVSQQINWINLTLAASPSILNSGEPIYTGKLEIVLRGGDARYLRLSGISALQIDMLSALII